MQCLILAAGKGERIRNKGDTKPLISFLGIPLIERVIYTCREAGLNDLYIVVGYNKDRIKERLRDGEKYGVKIIYIENDQWEKGNGISCLQARDYADGKFILMMSDHVINKEILLRIKKEKITDDEIILAVDYNRKNYIDIEDVTRVRVDGEKISDIGKNLRDYNGFDTGVFLCSPALFDALEKSLEAGDDTLSGGIRYLARKGKAKALDIGDLFWIDVDTENSFKQGERILLKGLKKKTDGPVSKILNRPLSIFLSRYLVKTPIKPNHISVISFLISVLAAAFFFIGNYTNLLIGGILAQFSSIIDGCDGEIARLKYQSTEFGGWFDAVLDRYADAFMVVGLTYYLWLLNPQVFIWLVGTLALLGTFMNSYTADKYDSYLIKKLKTSKYTWRIGRDIRIFIIFLGSVTNQVLIALAILAFLTNLEVIRRVYIISKRQ